ncbi:MAG: hypothetical protein RQ748_13005, partial [Elusimicrobiales bacterium]|nr:hypothetical protein [Elusimicrobiales bacterium]
LTSRYEFIPPLGLAWGWLLFRRRRELFRPDAVLVLLSGGGLLFLWAMHIKGLPAPGVRPDYIDPAANAVYHLGRMNFGVFLPAWGWVGALLFFIVLSASLAWRAVPVRGLFRAAVAGLLVWAVFFSVVYASRDHYPLHFMRHQLYFFLPFVFISAAALSPLAARRGAGELIASGLIFYAGLNYSAARSFDGEMRTNDIELALLSEADADWPAGAGFVYPAYEDRRAPLLRRFFPVYRSDCGAEPSRPLKYVSPVNKVFRNHRGRSMPVYALRTGDDVPWKSAVFKHAFYTTGDEEKKEPLRTVVGFFEPAGAAGEALLAYLDGRCRLRERDFKGAASAFAEAAAKGGGGREGSLAAVSLALAGDTAAAMKAAVVLGEEAPPELPAAISA